MNLQEFQEYYAKYGSIAALPRHPMRGAWRARHAPMIRHFEGKANKKFLEKFPNEPDNVKCYRASLWEPVSQAVLYKASDEMLRLFSRSKFTVQRENERFAEIAERKDIASIIHKSYPFRVKEPNSFRVWWPDEKAAAGTYETFVDFNLLKISANRVINYVEGQMLIYFAEGVDCDQFESMGQLFMINGGGSWDNALNDDTKSRTILHVVTDEEFINVDITNKGKVIAYTMYAHDYAGLPVTINGGRETEVVCTLTHTTHTIYTSDFGAALPALNAMEWRYNQAVSIDLSSGFPMKFLRGETCQPCQGHGKAPADENDPRYSKDNHDALYDCKSCNGTGQVIPQSPLLGYFQQTKGSGASPQERAQVVGTDPLSYVSPNMDVCRYQWERYDSEEERAQNILNVQQPVKIAQSGTAKRVDQEGLYMHAERIAHTVFDDIATHERMYQALTLGDNESRIVVHRSVTAQTENESELLELYTKTGKDAPLGMKAIMYMDWVAKKFATDDAIIKRERVAVAYAPYYLSSQDERNSAKGMRLPNAFREIVKATYVHYLLTQIENITSLDDKVIFSMLDLEVNLIIETQTPPTADKNELLGKVGGVTGLLETNKAVARGEVTEGAARGIVELMYETEGEKTNSVIGNATPVTPET